MFWIYEIKRGFSKHGIFINGKPLEGYFLKKKLVTNKYLEKNKDRLFYKEGFIKRNLFSNEFYMPFPYEKGGYYPISFYLKDKTTRL